MNSSLRTAGLFRCTALLACAALVACGGGGGSSGSPAPAPAPVPAPLPPASSLAQQCSPNNPYRGDAKSPTTVGSQTKEKQWIRSYVDEAYLWYDQVPQVDATLATYSNDTSAGFYGSVDNYFEALKTTQRTASGALVDKFSFTYPTKDWAALSQSGASLSHGAEWVLGSSTPPRNVRIAFTQPNSPAAQAGLQRGDVLVSVNGVSADDNTQAGIAVLNAALFPSGSTTRPADTFVVKRANVNQPAVSMTATNVVSTPVLSTKVLDVGGQKVGYILFNDHIVPAEGQLITAINTLKAGNVTDLVLDLRYNGGGYLFIASELSYMIAGPARTNGKLFEKSTYNKKRTADNAAAGTPFYNVSCILNSSFQCTNEAPLPTLNLSRVFVLTSPGTCSASEAIINGLEGIDVQVHRIGSTTCGKPYGFTAKDNCGLSYFPIEFKGANAKGFGDYSDGFAARCAASDDMTKPLGDVTEGQLAAALYFRANGSCAPASGSNKPRTLSALANNDAVIMVRPPVRENRILLPGGNR